MTFAPTGITNAAGPGLAIAGWGLMATGGATMVYSAATTIDKDNINKAKNAVGQVNMSFLEEDDDEDLVLNEKGKLLQGNDLKRVLKAAEKFNNTCRPVKGR